MSFANNFARILAPIAVVALAVPSLAATSGELRAVETSLAATESMTANFMQTDGKGRQMAGTLTLKRPGRIRFAYGGGVNMLLVANGKTLNFIDYDVGQKSSWPIGKSPLAVLLSPNPDLGRIARIMPSESKNVVVVRARDARRPEFGTIVLAFQRNSAAPGGISSKAGPRSTRRTSAPRCGCRASVLTCQYPIVRLISPSRNARKRSNRKRLMLATASRA